MWALTKNGYRLTCTLLQDTRGQYVLRLRCDGQRLLDERCDSPEHAMQRSLEALQVLSARGWSHDIVVH